MSDDATTGVEAKKPRKLGGDEGLVWIADDFDEYWDEEIELIAEGGDGFGLNSSWPPASKEKENEQ